MESLTETLQQALSGEGGLLPVLLAMGIAYLGGVLASLTPCVYPMIPITVSVVAGTKTHGVRHRWQALALRGAIYVSGMALVYSFLGVIAALSGKVFGTLTNNSGWYTVTASILVLASLIMLEAIPFEPLTWWEKIKHAFRGKGAVHPHHSHKALTGVGVFILGATSGLVAAPCTTPILTAILAFIANSQSVGLGFFLMCSFSLGLGTLLLIIAMFTGALQVLPRSGQWMKMLKTFGGLILLAFGCYLFYQAGAQS